MTKKIARVKRKDDSDAMRLTSVDSQVTQRDDHKEEKRKFNKYFSFSSYAYYANVYYSNEIADETKRGIIY